MKLSQEDIVEVKSSIVFRLPSRFFPFTWSTLAIGSIAVTLWWFLGSDVSFWDDYLLSSQLTIGPSSPLDFFLPNSTYFKAWPLTASAIWLVNRVGLEPMATFKFLSWLLHLANAFLVSKSVRSERLLVFAFYVFHPIAFLTLSWAFQFSSQLAIFAALGSYLVTQHALERKSISLASLASILLLISLLTKPWAVLLVLVAPLLAGTRLLRAKNSAPFLASIVAGTIVCLWLSFRAFNMSQDGLGYFPAEAPHRLEFETGLSHSVSPNPILDMERDRIRLAPSNQDRAIRKVLYVGESAFRYTAMAVGMSSFTTHDERPHKFTWQTVFGWGVIISYVIYLGSLGRAIISTRRARKPEDWATSGAMLWIGAGFLPVSGLFYLPHMKFSFTSPHYALLMLPGIAMLFSAMLEKLRPIMHNRVHIFGTSLVAILAFRQLLLYWSINHPSH